MPLCVKCNREVCNPCVRPPYGESHYRTIVVASDAELRRRSYFRRMAISTRDLIYLYEGPVELPGGSTFLISDSAIDDAFGDDGSFRWLSDFVRFADTPPRQAPQWRVLARLRLIDIAFKIARPDVARHFGR